MKKLLHRRCVHSLTAQHSGDGQRLLLRALLHVPHADVEVCSVNGTPNAARVAAEARAAGGDAGAAAAAATAAGHNSGTNGGAQPAANGTPDDADGGGRSGDGNGGAGAADELPPAAAPPPGTCGPAGCYTHSVEVVLRAADGALLACSSSCCGVGYDALQAQYCPAVAAALLAARLGGGAGVLCEHDVQALLGRAVAAAGDGGDSDGSEHGGKGGEEAAGEAAAALLGVLRDGAAAAGLPSLARVLVAASGGALALGPNHVVRGAAVGGRMRPGACSAARERSATRYASPGYRGKGQDTNALLWLNEGVGTQARRYEPSGSSWAPYLVPRPPLLD